MRALSALSLLCASLLAAQTTQVDMRAEPHHTLEFQNDYVRVYRVTVPARESLPAILHAHDYLTVQLARPPESPPEERPLVAARSPDFMALADSQPPMRLRHAKTTTPAYVNPSNAESVSLVIELLQDPEIPGGSSSPSPPRFWDAGHGVRGAYWFRSTTRKSRGWDATVPPGGVYRPAKTCSPRRLLLIADTPLPVHMLTPGELLMSVDAGQQLWIDRNQTFEIKNDGTQPLHFFVVSFAERNC